MSAKLRLFWGLWVVPVVTNIGKMALSTPQILKPVLYRIKCITDIVLDHLENLLEV
jgi:hypothetical protein